MERYGTLCEQRTAFLDVRRKPHCLCCCVVSVQHKESRNPFLLSFKDLTGQPMANANEELSPEYAIITGAWVLDLSRSDAFDSYLQCLGAQPQIIRAQAVGEREHQSRNVIALDESQLVIHKNTAFNNFTERFRLNEEHVTLARPWNRQPDGGGGGGGGRNLVTVSLGDSGQLDGYVVAATTCAPNGRPTVETVEVRQLTDRGLTHVQQISVKNLLTGGQSDVMRTWARVPMTGEDHLRLLAA